MSGWVVRPARADDVDALHAMARDSLAGVTSLPDDRAQWLERLQRTEAAFANPASGPAEVDYVFVLEELGTGALLGCASLQANCGYSQPFYSLRQDTFIHASPSLGIKHTVQALSLCHDLCGGTLLRGFYVRPAWRDGPAAELISRARLLFIAAHRDRFAARLIAEIVGHTDEQGCSAFWEAVGQRFFGMDYAEAEALGASPDRTYMAELLPHYPIYVPLLPEPAQRVIGQVNPGAERPYRILVGEGFTHTRYVDVYDAGPTLEADTAQVRSIAHSHAAPSRISHAAPGANACDWLVCNQQVAGFRALIIHTRWLPGRPLALSAAHAAALHLNEGDPVRLVRLQEHT